MIIAKKWKQSKCPSTAEWTNKMWYNYIMQYYLAMKRHEVLISERNLSQKTVHYMTQCIQNVQTRGQNL